MASLGTVILFARAAQYGRGKRRLARDVGDLAAARFYRSALARSLAVVARRQGWRAEIALDPARARARPGRPFAHGPGGRLPRRAQMGRDLGERMAMALRQAPPGPVILIGADIPGVTPQALRRALLACRAADMVYGPAEDGGFWLVGCKRRPSLRHFDGVRWSNATTLEQAMAAAPAPWRFRLVDRLADVDDAGDLPKYP